MTKKLRQSYEELQNTAENLQREVLGLRQAIGGNAEVLSAIVSLLGESSVQGEMERMRQERQDAQESQMAAGVKLLVEAGVLKPVAETTLGNLVVGTDKNPDGKTRRVQFELKEQVVPADILPKFLGKKPGESIENNGVTLTIVEVYEVDKVRAAEFQAEQARKAPAAAPRPAPALPVDEAAQKAIDESGEPAPSTDAPQA